MEARKQSRRDQILSALAEMLESSPNGRITTAALAHHLGVSEAALYRHFPSKARMYESLLEFTEDAIFSRIKSILADEPTIEARCYGILTLVLNFCEKNPGISRMIAGDALAGETERLHSRITQIMERIETQLKQTLREAEVGENKRTALSVTETADLLVGLAEGKIRQFVRSGFTRLPSTHWSQQWQLLVNNLFR